jgi:hypothetical protein
MNAFPPAFPVPPGRGGDLRRSVVVTAERLSSKAERYASVVRVSHIAKCLRLADHAACDLRPTWAEAIGLARQGA